MGYHAVNSVNFLLPLFTAQQPRRAQFSSTSWGKHEITQIDINSPKSAFLNENIS